MELILQKMDKMSLENYEIKTIDNCSIIDYKIEQELIKLFKNIVIKNENHNFPKKKIAWLNYIKNQRKITKLSIDYDPENVLLQIIYNYPVYSFEKNIYNNVIQLLKDYNIKLNIYNYKDVIEYIKHYCKLIIEIDQEKVLNILIKNNIIEIKNNKYLLYKCFAKEDKKRKIEVIEEDEEIKKIKSNII